MSLLVRLFSHIHIPVLSGVFYPEANQSRPTITIVNKTFYLTHSDVCGLLASHFT